LRWHKRQIVSAWYLGMVGDVVSGKVIAYEQALMFDPVRDAVVVPSRSTIFARIEQTWPQGRA
jgi:hypothetical protein